MRIAVKALPVQEVIRDISEQWQVSIQENEGELSIAVPPEIGEGFIRCQNFDSGIGVIEYDLKFFKDYQFLFSINKTHPLKFIFCSEGTADHLFEEDEDTHTIQTYQNVIVSSSRNNGHILAFKANVKAHITSIEIIRSVFSKRSNHNFDGLEPELKELFEDSVAKRKFFYQGNYSIKAADIVEEITGRKFTGFLNSIFLEGKLLEILVIQINQYQDDQRSDKTPQILRRNIVGKVEKAVQIINNDIGTNIAVEQLAKEVGTNINKLQEGFKYMFNLTINRYMQQVKLEKAKELLINSDQNISEIVNTIGLTNRSYFSKIFRERYGVSPKYFLRSFKVENGENKNGLKEIDKRKN